MVRQRLGFLPLFGSYPGPFPCLDAVQQTPMPVVPLLGDGAVGIADGSYLLGPSLGSVASPPSEAALDVTKPASTPAARAQRISVHDLAVPSNAATPAYWPDSLRGFKLPHALSTVSNDLSHGPIAVAVELNNGGPSREAVEVAQHLPMTALRPMSLEDHGIEVDYPRDLPILRRSLEVARPTRLDVMPWPDRS